MASLLEKLEAIETKYKELESLIADPSVIADIDRWQHYNKEHAALLPIVEKILEYRKVTQDIEDDKSLLSDQPDDELRHLIEDELAELKERNAALEKELPILLLPKDPNDEKNVIMEIRGGVGGDEAALFAGDLFRMYSR